MITVLDYELGNIGSIRNAFDKLGEKTRVTCNAQVISEAAALVFPGDGAAGKAMENLKRLKLIDPIMKYIQSGKPFLGICLGMQILLESSEEGNVKCLGVIKGKVKKFTSSLKIPQIGWNQVKYTGELNNEDLFDKIPNNSFFYFINSFFCEPIEKSMVKGVTDYGQKFCSFLKCKNISGVQFHPEKSGDIGIIFLQNFLKSI